MNHTAWSALAERFADQSLEAYAHFTLWAPPETRAGDLRPARPAGPLRYQVDNPLIRAATGAPVLEVYGPGAPREFVALSRLRWLSWAAGRLLDPSAARPDLAWLARLTPTRDGVASGEHVRVGPASADLARRFSSDPPPRPATPGAPLEEWRVPFGTLREHFSARSREHSECYMQLVAGGGFLAPIYCASDATSWRFGQGHDIGKPWKTCFATGYTICGDPDFTEAFVGLAETAARSLPSALRLPLPLVPLGGRDHPPTDAPVSDFVAWLEFLWLARPTEFAALLTESVNNPAVQAEWRGGNPCLASVLAIDQFLAVPDAGLRRVLELRASEACPWFAPADRVAVRAAIEAAHAPAPPAGHADPITVADIADFLRHQKQAAELEAHSAVARMPHRIEDIGRIAQQMAFLSPRPTRLTVEAAAAIPVYRRLVREARGNYHSDLDGQTLLLVLADIAERINRAPGELMAMEVGEFGRVWRSEAAKPIFAPPIATVTPTSQPGSDPLTDLPPSRRAAWSQYQWVVNVPDYAGASDKQAYEWYVAKHPDETVPDCEAWMRYVRQCRKALNAQKNTPAAGRPHGGSVVGADGV